MPKFVKIDKVDGFPFAHNFSDKDWKALQELEGKSKGSVKLSDGPATTDGKYVFVTLKAPGGSKTYSLPVGKLFK